jgi:pteridine reductase
MAAATARVSAALWAIACACGLGSGGVLIACPERLKFYALGQESRMQSKVALITGGARRVGAAICRLLHGNGVNLMVHYRSSAEEARALQAELNAVRPESVALVQADLLSLPGLPTMVADTIRRFGRLDVLINNASSFFPTPVGDIGEREWDDLVGTNLKTPLFLSQAAAPHLKRVQGCIVNIVDIHADRPMRNYLVYSVAKGGLMALTRALASELAPEVRVNGVSPGAILWPEDERWADELARQRIIHSTLLKRTGEPEDIALTVRFLVFDAPYVTGQIVNVDGGRSIHL